MYEHVCVVCACVRCMYVWYAYIHKVGHVCGMCVYVMCGVLV